MNAATRFHKSLARLRARELEVVGIQFSVNRYIKSLTDQSLNFNMVLFRFRE